jgi:hypothetical protein
MTTNAYAAKRAIIDRLILAATQRGNPLADNAATVQYAFNPTTATDVTVYGGGLTFDQDPANEAVDGERRRLVQEVASLALVVRVQRVPDPATVEQIRDTDEVCENIGDFIGDLFSREPRLAGGSSITRIRSGLGDYDPTDTRAVSRLSYLVDVTSHFQQPSV